MQSYMGPYKDYILMGNEYPETVETGNTQIGECLWKKQECQNL